MTGATNPLLLDRAGPPVEDAGMEMAGIAGVAEGLPTGAPAGFALVAGEGI
jgi:hypothetical protein